MINIIQNYKKIIISVWVFLLTSIGIISCFDKALGAGLLMVFFLSLITYLVLYKFGLKDKRMFQLFLIVLFIHLAAVMFIFYADFQPLSGGSGDYLFYQDIAEKVAQRVNQGNYSLEGIGMPHYYPAIIGIIYALTFPEMLIGQLFGAWLAAITVILVYLMILEIKGSKKWAFLIGLIVCIYPSYLFFCSLLLKDTVVVPLVILCMLLFVKIIKNFSWKYFLIFYIALICLIHFRFYVGYAVLFSFVLCWILVLGLDFRKKIIYGIITIVFLGFSPYVLGYGYYGTETLDIYLNEETITVYREVVYAPTPVASVVEKPTAEEPTAEEPTAEEPTAEEPTVEKPTVEKPTVEKPTVEKPTAEKPTAEKPTAEKPTVEKPTVGLGSSFLVETGFESPFKFVKNSIYSFIYSLLGPFPWQIKTKQQFFALFETIPWYFLFFFSITGIVRLVKENGLIKFVTKYRVIIPLLLFSIMSLAALSLYINNFGIITRIRIPSFIILLCLLPFNIKLSKKLAKLFYETKIIKFFNLPKLQ